MKKEKGNKLFHKIDRYLGIPVILTLGLFHRKRTQPKEINSIAILNIGSIGDNVLMSGSIVDLHTKYPDAVIDVYTGSSNYQIVQQIPYIRKISRLPITNPIKTIRHIKNVGNYDVVFDFGPWPRTNAIYAYCFKTNYLVGFKTEGQFRHYVYDCTVEHSSQIHEIDNHRNLIKVLCNEATNHSPMLQIGNVDLSRFYLDFAQKICLIHPWSAGLRKFDKQWKNENWVDLCNRISKDYDLFIITGAPSDVKDSDLLLNQILMSNKLIPIISLAGKLSLAETSKLISLSSFIFCVDTGIAHMAAAFNKLQICLQGPAKSLRWRPYSDNAIVVNPSFGNYGYISLGFEKVPNKENCMDNISVENVYETFKKLKQ